MKEHNYIKSLESENRAFRKALNTLYDTFRAFDEVSADHLIAGIEEQINQSKFEDLLGEELKVRAAEGGDSMKDFLIALGKLGRNNED